MAYDAETFTIDPLTLTTPRARLEYLRDFLRRLPAERFDMAEWACSPHDFYVAPEALRNDRGTAGCIGGWTNTLFGAVSFYDSDIAADHLGLTGSQAARLFFGNAGGLGYQTITPLAAANVLDHLIRTGEVDWSVARAAP